jgi:hypothetical protein
VNGQGAATSTGIFPAQAEPAEAERGADHVSARASATSDRRIAAHAASGPHAAEGGGALISVARP